MAESRPGTRKVPQVGKVLPGDVPYPVGTLQYDNGIPVSRDGALAVHIGNTFIAPPPNPSFTFSLFQVTFKLAGCFTTPYPGARVFIHDVNPSAMTVMQLAAFSAGAGPGANCNGQALYTGMLPAPIMNLTGVFFAGILNTPFAGCAGNTMVGGTCEGVALTAGALDPGMGFHAARVQGGTFQAILPARNAIMRATGGNLPVELMGFGVE